MGRLAEGVLTKIMSPGQTRITAEQAQQFSPQQVQDVVNDANDVCPGVADQLGKFYAQHKSLLNTLGGIAANIVMMKMKDHFSSK